VAAWIDIGGILFSKTSNRYGNWMRFLGEGIHDKLGTGTMYIQPNHCKYH
jgi:hypothetical protein